MATATVLFLVSLVSSGLTIRVPEDQPTITAALEVAADGDEVVISPGTYNEYDLDFSGKAITVRSTNPEDPATVVSTVIDAMGLGGRFILENGETETSEISGLTIRNAHCWWGGGVLCWRASPTISNCLIEDCAVYSYGGGIGVWDGAPRISGCVIRNNVAESSNGGWGAGVAVKRTIWSTAEIHLEDCILYNNVADTFGGGIWVDADLYDEPVTGEIRRCVIENNQGHKGAGVYLFHAVVSVENCRIIKNHGEPDCTSVYGAGIYACAGDVEILNTLVARNTAIDTFWGQGAGLNLDTDAIVSNCAIFENTANRFGGGIFVDFSRSVRITNTILWNNAPDSIFSSSSDLSVTHSDVQGGWPGMGNIVADPLFLDPQNDDFHLTYASPCIDAGDNDAPSLPAKDFEGDPRIFPGNGKGMYPVGSPSPGAVVDMGVDEYCLMKRQKVLQK